MTTFSFHTTVLGDGMLAVPLPEELRGLEVELDVFPQRKTTMSDRHDRTPQSGQWTEDGTQKGILSIAGILKDCPNENIRDDRYEYLMAKYGHGRNTD